MFVGNSILPHLRRLSRAECRHGILAALGSSHSARVRRGTLAGSLFYKHLAPSGAPSRQKARARAPAPSGWNACSVCFFRRG